MSRAVVDIGVPVRVIPALAAELRTKGSMDGSCFARVPPVIAGGRLAMSACCSRCRIAGSMFDSPQSAQNLMRVSRAHGGLSLVPPHHQQVAPGRALYFHWTLVKTEPASPACPRWRPRPTAGDLPCPATRSDRWLRATGRGGACRAARRCRRGPCGSSRGAHPRGGRARAPGTSSSTPGGTAGPSRCAGRPDRSRRNLLSPHPAVLGLFADVLLSPPGLEPGEAHPDHPGVWQTILAVRSRARKDVVESDVHQAVAARSRLGNLADVRTGLHGWWAAHGSSNQHTRQRFPSATSRSILSAARGSLLTTGSSLASSSGGAT